MKVKLHRWFITTLELFTAALVTALVTIGLAGFLSNINGSQELAERVDRNVQVIVCILQIPIEDRTDERIDTCKLIYGFPGDP